MNPELNIPNGLRGGISGVDLQPLHKGTQKLGDSRGPFLEEGATGNVLPAALTRFSCHVAFASGKEKGCLFKHTDAPRLLWKMLLSLSFVTTVPRLYSTQT